MDNCYDGLAPAIHAAFVRHEAKEQWLDDAQTNAIDGTEGSHPTQVLAVFLHQKRDPRWEIFIQGTDTYCHLKKKKIINSKVPNGIWDSSQEGSTNHLGCYVQNICQPDRTRLFGRSGEKAQPMRPAAQMIDPMKIKAGRGRRSAKKPEGSAKIDSKMPRTKPKLLRPPGVQKEMADPILQSISAYPVHPFTSQ